MIMNVSQSAEVYCETINMLKLSVKTKHFASSPMIPPHVCSLRSRLDSGLSTPM